MLFGQYANANNIKNLLYGYISSDNPLEYYEGFNSFLNIDYMEFYTTFFNIYTANTAGLDNWGSILGISRNIYVPAYPYFFGFNSTNRPFTVTANVGTQSFNYGGFNSGATTYQPVDDNFFRAMLLLRYQTLTCNMSILAITTILNTFFANLSKFAIADNPTRRRFLAAQQTVSVQDNLAPMSITYTFSQKLTVQQGAIFSAQNNTVSLLPRPLGVEAIIVQP